MSMNLKPQMTYGVVYEIILLVIVVYYTLVQ
jgi:hypothetical protein